MSKQNDERVNEIVDEILENAEKRKKEEAATNEKHEIIEEIEKTEEKPKKKKKGLKILLWILMIVLFIIIALCVTAVVMMKIGEKQMTDYEEVVVEVPEIAETIINDGKTVIYNGQKYTLNENIVSVLAMGVDRYKLIENGEDRHGRNGQADTILLLTIDSKTGKMKVVSISRETMADVDVYSESGVYSGINKEQICLAYAYGDGQHTSCENVLKSVNRLFYGIPINSYVAINITSIASLNDVVGGVTLKAIGDFQMPSGRFIKNGETVTLKGKEAEVYIRNRDQEIVEANTERMGRQVQYIKAFAAKTLTMTKSDISTPVKLYDGLSKNGDLISNINTAQISFLTECVLKNPSVDDVEFISIKGETKLGDDGYAQFYPDETAFFEMILDVFYIKQ